MLIGMGGTSLWGIICYAMHQMRATQSEKDDIHHQIQIILRNASSGWNIIIGLWKIAWARRGTSTPILLRALPLVAVSTMYLSALAVASLLSSRAIVGNNEVLIRGTTCGWQGEYPATGDLQSPRDYATADALIVSSRSSLQKSAAYVESCYGNDTDSASCGSYVKDNVVSAIDFNAPCPFAVKLCAASAISIDSGLLDSDRHLGVNSHTKERVSFRKVTTCSPFSAQNYTVLTNLTLNGTVINLQAYAFGPVNQELYGTLLSQYTFAVDNVSLAMPAPELADDLHYDLKYVCSAQ